jgi:hypothetical protein
MLKVDKGIAEATNSAVYPIALQISFFDVITLFIFASPLFKYNLFSNK